MNEQLIEYQSQDGQVTFQVNVFEETVWLTQKQMADLFDKERSVITKHINNIFKEGELSKKSNVQKMHISSSDKPIALYNLDVIISVGYRVKSIRGTQFRQWATKILKQYMLNGYAINDVRVRKIESAIDDLVDSHKLLREDVDSIKHHLLKLIERPIVIQSHHQHNVNIGGEKLERKIIELIDKLIAESESKPVRHELIDVKADLEKASTDEKAKNRILRFFTALGDPKSDKHKALKGAGIAKGLIVDLVKLGSKFF